MKTGNLLGFALVATLVAAPHTAFAAGFANTAQSGTATGMAGVATGNPDEPNANFYNPSSMAFSQGIEINAGPTIIVPSVSYESIDGEITENTEAAIFPPPNFSLAIPVAGGFTAGLGVTLPWGLAITWPQDWVGRENFQAQSLRTINVNPNVAYKVPGLDLGVAAGVQVMRSELSQSRTIILRDDREAQVELGGVGYGVGGTFAAMYRPTDAITVGLNYRSGAKIDYHGHARFSENVEGTPFEDRMVDQEIATSIDIPHTINLGLGWQLTEALWLGVDVNYYTWSAYDSVEVEFSEQSPEGEPAKVIRPWWSTPIGTTPPPSGSVANTRLSTIYESVSASPSI